MAETIEAPRTTADEPQAAPAMESLDQLVARHRAELADAVARAERAAEGTADALRDAVNAHAGVALGAALDEVRQALATAQEAGNLRAVLVTTAPPGGLGRELAQAAKVAEPGERAVVVLVPGQTSTGWQERRAWAFFDASDVVWK